MFERFTERARQVVVLAQEAAREWGSDHIDVEHVLIGLAGEKEGLGARVLEDLGATEGNIREAVAQHNPPGEPSRSSDQLPFTPEAKRILELVFHVYDSGELRRTLQTREDFLSVPGVVDVREDGPGEITLIATDVLAVADATRDRHPVSLLVHVLPLDPEPCAYCQAKGRDWTTECEDNK